MLLYIMVLRRSSLCSIIAILECVFYVYNTMNILKSNYKCVGLTSITFVFKALAAGKQSVIFCKKVFDVCS